MNPGEFAGAKEPGELTGITAIRLHPVAGLGWNLRRRDHDALASVLSEGQSTLPYWLQTSAIGLYVVVLLVLYARDGKRAEPIK